jgi:hypothetical protein
MGNNVGPMGALLLCLLDQLVDFPVVRNPNRDPFFLFYYTLILSHLPCVGRGRSAAFDDKCREIGCGRSRISNDGCTQIACDPRLLQLNRGWAVRLNEAVGVTLSQVARSAFSPTIEHGASCGTRCSGTRNRGVADSMLWVLCLHHSGMPAIRIPVISRF